MTPILIFISLLILLNSFQVKCDVICYYYSNYPLLNVNQSINCPYACCSKISNSKEDTCCGLSNYYWIVIGSLACLGLIVAFVLFFCLNMSIPHKRIIAEDTDELPENVLEAFGSIINSNEKTMQRSENIIDQATTTLIKSAEEKHDIIINQKSAVIHIKPENNTDFIVALPGSVHVS